MKLKLSISILPIFLASLISGQDYTDQIITKSSDTIICRITLVNDQNIFYYYQKRKIEKAAYISLTEVGTYNWLSKDQVYGKPDQTLKYPYKTNSDWHMSGMLTEEINYPISHLIFAFYLNKRNHNIFVGANYTYLFKNNFGVDVVDDYEQHTIGGTVGYRYVFDSRWVRTHFFLQMDYSIYPVKYKYYAGHHGGIYDEKEVIFENNASIGWNYKIAPKLNIFGGIGLGSTAGFFLILDHAHPHVYVGMEFF